MVKVGYGPFSLLALLNVRLCYSLAGHLPATQVINVSYNNDKRVIDQCSEITKKGIRNYSLNVALCLTTLFLNFKNIIIIKKS